MSLPRSFPFSDRSGAMLPSLDADQSGPSRSYSVIVVNTRAAAHLDLGLRWNDEIGV